MSKMNLLKLLTLVLLGTTFGYAQASRTWVSGVGDDANPCSRTAPCKTFAGAISKTAVGGEIDALDPGGFGAVTITKSITIDGGGGQVASVLVSGTNAIVVTPGANDVVILRNLRITGLNGLGLNGIRWIAGKALHVEHCSIFGNGGSGISSLNSVNNVLILVDSSRFENNHDGVFASNFSAYSVKNSDASGNTNDGFISFSNGGVAEINIANSVASNNTSVGISAGAGTSTSIVRLTGVSLFGNGMGMAIGANGTIGSWVNNYNSGSGAPNATAMPQ